MGSAGVPALFTISSDPDRPITYQSRTKTITGIIAVFEEENYQDLLGDTGLERVRTLSLTVLRDENHPIYKGIADPEMKASVTIGTEKWGIAEIIGKTDTFVSMEIVRAEPFERTTPNFRTLQVR